MKRMIIGVLLLGLLLAGCAARGEGQPEQSPEPTQSDAAPQQTQTPQVTEPARPRLLESAETADGVLYAIPNAVIEENMMQELSVFQGQLLSAFYVYDMQTQSDVLHLRLLSLDSGELLGEARVPTEVSYSVTVQVCGECVVVGDGSSGTVRVFDTRLNETAQYEAAGQRIFVNQSVTAACCLTAEGVRMVELETGRARTVLDGAADLSLYAQTDSTVTVRYIDLTDAGRRERWAAIELETGAVETLDIDDSLSGMACADGMWVGELLSEGDTYLLGAQQELCRFRLDEDYPMLTLTGDPTRLILRTTRTDGTQSLTAYDAEGKFLSSCTVSGGSLMLKQAWLDGGQGCFLIAIGDDGCDRLYYWDVTAETQGEDLELLPYGARELTGTVLPEEYYRRAQELSRQYGVSIRIGELCPIECGDKLMEQECDAQRVKLGLDVLERALAAYPEGFFRGLRYGSMRTIEIDLAGEISNREPIAGYQPTAFVRQEDGVICVVLNINVGEQALEQNFYHETSHVIDKAMAHIALYREGTLYSEEGWLALNPPEFAALNPEEGGYYGSYAMMPMEYYQEAFTSCFISDYGKSFATEDRATVFETAMIGQDRVFQASETLYAKLDYYCRCIRDCFATEDWPEQTQWEKALG